MQTSTPQEQAEGEASPAAAAYRLDDDCPQRLAAAERLNEEQNAHWRDRLDKLQTQLAAERERFKTQTEFVKVRETDREAEAYRTAMRRVTQLHGQGAADVCTLVEGVKKQLVDGQRARDSAAGPQGPLGQPHPVPPASGWKDD